MCTGAVYVFSRETTGWSQRGYLKASASRPGSSLGFHLTLSGDGRVVITAAQRFGTRGTGIEIDPRLIALARAGANAAGVAGRTSFLEQDLYNTDLGGATVITLYLLPAVNMKLRPALKKLKPGTRIVSHDWDMGDWQPDRSVVVPAPEKRIGLAKTSNLMLWIVR